MKRNESKIAFICFHFLLRIGTFQWVTADLNKKIFSFDSLSSTSLRSTRIRVSLILNNISSWFAQDNVGLWMAVGPASHGLVLTIRGWIRDWPSIPLRPAANTIMTTATARHERPRAAEKPHRRHGLAEERRSPDLIQLHYRGKTSEIRLDLFKSGRMVESRRNPPCRQSPESRSSSSATPTRTSRRIRSRARSNGCHS